MNDKIDDELENIHNERMRFLLKDFIYKNLTHLLPFTPKIDDGIEFRFESIFKNPDDENKWHSRLSFRLSDTEIKHLLHGYIGSNYRVDNKCKKHAFIGFIKNIGCEYIEDFYNRSYNPSSKSVKFDQLIILSKQEEFPEVSKIEYATESTNSPFFGRGYKAKKYKITLEEIAND